MISGSAFSQCNNSIELKNVSSDKRTLKSGVIELSVTTSKEFVCTLKIEKGSGPETVKELKGSGSRTVRFEALDTQAIYQVQIKFLDEEKPLCQILQKSQIFFE
jgi:hypothetical protein